MIEEYEGIKNSKPDTCGTPSALYAIAKIPNPKSQQLELWSPTREIMNQMGVKLEKN